MLRSRALALAALVLVGACGDDPADPLGASSLEVVQGPPSSVVPLRDTTTIIVRAVDAEGRAVPGTPVLWSVTEGGGSVQPVDERTGSDGLAAARWVPGELPGPQAVQAALAGEASLVLRTEAEAYRADAVEAGFDFACALRNGETWCLGHIGSSFGAPQQPQFTAAPLRFFPTVTATELAVSYGGACVTNAAGEVYCRGQGSSYGRGSDLGGRRIEGLPPLERIHGKVYLFCGIARADRTAWCWTDAGAQIAVRQASPTLEFLEVTTGGQFGRVACGIATDERPYCWEFQGTPTPVDLPGGGARDIAVGEGFACATDPTAAVYCWVPPGDFPEGGGLGATPTLVTRGAPRISAGFDGLFVDAAGTYSAFFRAQEQAGLDLLTRLRAVSVSANRASCALSAGGEVYCSGGIALPSPGSDPSQQARFFAIPPVE